MIRGLVAAAALWLVLTAAKSAHAFPTMIRHDYAGCVPCHLDPSGEGVLTPYGRAQSSLLLSTRWGNQAADEEPGSFKDFLFGAFVTPEWLLLQGWVRNAYLWTVNESAAVVDQRFLQMRADVEAAVSAGVLRAAVTLGYNDIAGEAFSRQAWVTTSNTFGNLVSREHWAGVALADDQLWVRAGRIALPFGLRNIEHPFFVRQATRTDIDQDQQHGVAVAWNSERVRAEAMAILGNYQISPDAVRDRGYSAYAELHLAPRYALGLSSLVVHADQDLLSNVETWRQAHGGFARLAPIRPIVLLAEADALVTSPSGAATAAGYTGLAQLDVEPIQGLHGIAAVEVLRTGLPGDPFTNNLWLGALWFPIPHVELRVDGVRTSAEGTPALYLYLVQGQIYL